MKRCLVLLLAIVLLCMLAACGNDGATTIPMSSAPETTVAVQQITQPTTETPTTVSPTTTAPATAAPTTVQPTTVHTHSYTQTVTEANCVNGGYTTNTCACGNSYRSDEKDALGHSWNEATCTAPKTCISCGIFEGENASHQYIDGECTTCDSKQLGVGCWKYRGVDDGRFGEWVIDFDNAIVRYTGYEKVDNIDAETLASIKNSGKEVVVYESVEYVAAMGDSVPIQCKISEDSVKVDFIDISGSAAMERLAANQIKVTVTAGNDYFAKEGWVFVYQGKSVVVEPTETEPPTINEIPDSWPEQLKELADQITGRWYLEGYADVYLDISYEDPQDQYETYVSILAENFSFKDNGVSDGSGSYHINEYTIYPGQPIEQYPNGVSWVPGISIFLSSWNSTLAEYDISIGNNVIYIDSYEFVRTQGTKNQQTEMGENEVPSATEFPTMEPLTTNPPTTEPMATEPPATESPATECYVDVLIISDKQTISNQTIDTDVYITSAGVATFDNVTINGNIYCYGKLTVKGGSVNNIYAYYWDLGGITSSCAAWDGSHGLVKGAFGACGDVIIKDYALDFAFGKWGKR